MNPAAQVDCPLACSFTEHEPHIWTYALGIGQPLVIVECPGHEDAPYRGPDLGYRDEQTGAWVTGEGGSLPQRAT